MLFRNGLFTSESVSAGHPDKLCDRISDGILDAFLTLDPMSRVACQTFAAHGKLIVAGEFRTRDPAHFDAVQGQAEAIVRETLRQAGYGEADLDIDPARCAVEIRFNRQSPQIAAGVDQAGGVLGAGDQGILFGHATAETEALMPLAWSLATDLIARGMSLRETGQSPLRPDAKSQVTVRYRDGQPAGVQTVLVSWQHQPGVAVEELRGYVASHVVDPVVPHALRTEDFRLLVNPAGAWTLGGPKADTGLTGRKNVVDTYGGACPHGGGALSGKDPSKVDRSGAYAARYVAKHVVAAGLARRCTVQLAYAIGRPDPVSLNVDLHGTGRVADDVLTAAIPAVFDLTPAGMLRELDLLRPIYRATAVLGHFGRWRDPAVYAWERTPRCAELRRAVAAQFAP
jgi:S-adenosylmethionine synthetase